MAIFSDKNLLPQLKNILAQAPEDKLFFNSYGLKHPHAIFNVSFGKIENSLNEFLDAYDAFVKAGFESKKDERTTPLLKSYQHFLYVLREYLDDIFHITKCFIEPLPSYRPNRNQYDWLKLNVPKVVEDLFEQTAEYKSYLDRSVNALKHNNAILGSISFYSDHSPDVCIGYFVANVVDGCYRPIPEIHKQFNGYDTGFSFRRDLTYNLFNVYFLAEQVRDLLLKHFGIDSQSPMIQPDVPRRKQLFERVIALPRIHLPDEYQKPVPSISMTTEEILKLDYPSFLSIKPMKLEKIVLTHSTDGHTASYGLLYGSPK